MYTQHHLIFSCLLFVDSFVANLYSTFPLSRCHLVDEPANKGEWHWMHSPPCFHSNDLFYLWWFIKQWWSISFIHFFGLDLQVNDFAILVLESAVVLLGRHFTCLFTCSQDRFRPSIRRPIRCRNHGMRSIDFRLQWICFETIHILKRFADNFLANIPFFNSCSHCSVRNYRVSQCHQLWGHHFDVPFHPFILIHFWLTFNQAMEQHRTHAQA